MGSSDLRTSSAAPAFVDPLSSERAALQLLTEGTDEESTRRLTETATEEFVKGNPLGLLALPVHSCSLLSYNAHHARLLSAFRAAEAHDLSHLKSLREASLLAQVNQWGHAERILECFPPGISPFQDFLLAKIRNAQGNPAEHLSDHRQKEIRYALGPSSELEFDLLRDLMVRGDEAAFARGLEKVEIDSAVLSVCRGALAREGAYAASVRRGARGSSPAALNRIGERVLAVYGMRCTGGSAVQDWLDDFSSVASSAGEYLAISGWYGIRSLLNQYASGRKARSAGPLLDFVVHHVCGLSVPLSRSFSRIRRQALADRRSGVLAPNLEVLAESLAAHEDVFGFLFHWFAGTWSNYLAHRDGAEVLLLRKLFSSGNLDLLHVLPPLRGMMVWRDPRDQYVDQVQRGFVKAGDADAFVKGLVSKVQLYRQCLDACSEQHRDRMIDVSFDRFVLDAGYRDELSGWTGLSKGAYAERRFSPSRSARNIGIWKGQVSSTELRVIEANLRPLLEFSRGGGTLDYARLLQAQ